MAIKEFAQECMSNSVPNSLSSNNIIAIKVNCNMHMILCTQADEFLQPAVVDTFQEATVNAINTYYSKKLATCYSYSV